jgi:hypothetical protein
MDKIRLGVVYPLVIGFALLLIGAVFIVFLNQTMKKNALQEAEEKADIILYRNLSTHTYFSHELKPAVFALTDSFRDTDYFHPSWMSSTYAVRGIEKNFQKLSKQNYYYKESAINARNPENEADEYESDFIKKLNKTNALKKKTALRTIDGKPFFVVMHSGEVMEKSCLRCHGNYKNAPEDLVKKYGKERSFNRSVDEVVSAISLRIPLEVPYAAANKLSMKLSIYIMVLLFLFYLFMSWFIRKLVFVPLARIHDNTCTIISGTEHLGEKIALPFGKELYDLTIAFNTLSCDLRQHLNLLETRVIERTRELADANEKVKEYYRLKSLFIASMSHEFRTLLNTILGFSAIILDGLSGGITELQKNQLERVHGAAEHLLTMISDIMDIFNIEAGMATVKPVDFSLHEFALEAIDTVLPRVQEKGLSLDFNVPSDIQMCSDRKYLMQCLLKLLRNAVQFTEKGSLFVLAEKKDTMIVLSVSDTGTGISASDIPHLFHTLERIETHSKLKTGNTGLGLYLTHKIVTEFLHGTIEVESEIGKGTTFTITIPSNEAAHL